MKVFFQSLYKNLGYFSTKIRFLQDLCRSKRITKTFSFITNYHYLATLQIIYC